MSVIDEIESEYAQRRVALQEQYEKDSAALEKRVEGWDPYEAGRVRGAAYHEMMDEQRLLREAEKAALQERANEVLADIAAAAAALTDEVRVLLEGGVATRGLHTITDDALALQAAERRLYAALGIRLREAAEQQLTWEVVLRRVQHLGTLGLGNPLPDSQAPAEPSLSHVPGQFDSWETPGDGSSTLMFGALDLNAEEVA